MAMLDQTPRPAISRLPPRRGLPLLDSFVGDLVLRPWLDAVGLIGVVRWLFPLSRAWAAAGLAGDSVEIFRAETGVTADAARQVQPALDALLARRRAYEAAARRWEEAVFADAASDTASRVAAEKQRLRSAQAWMSGRSLFLPLHLRSGVPPVKWQFPTEDEVDARHGARLADSALAFPAPLPVAVQQSQPLPGAGGDTSWLRFPTQVSGAPARRGRASLRPRRRRIRRP
jgi:hypothetical protein